jgi:hypothetical protein
MTIVTRPQARKIFWQKFEQGVCDYGKSGTERVTYWLRLGKDIHKITRATPSAYDAMTWAHANQFRARAYECYCFGHEAVGLPPRRNAALAA